jgi:hypothetical protein
MSTANCNSCSVSMQALFHIERSQRLLNAAYGTRGLSDEVYRNTLAVAVRSLDAAVSALQSRSALGVSHV